MSENTALRLKRALSLRNMKQIELVEKTQIGKSAISQYIAGKVVPKQDKIYLMAKALNVSEAWLMGHDVPMGREAVSPSLPSLTPKDERSIQKKLEEILEGLAPNSAMAYYNDEEPMDESDRELLRISLENTLRMAKQMAKQKFTPKKYRKE